MKIVSDNEEFLKEIETRFKKERVKVTSVKVPADVTDKGIVEDIIQLIVENPDESQVVIEYVLDELTSLYKQEHINVIKKDGIKISYAEYKMMSDEEKSKEIFSV